MSAKVIPITRNLEAAWADDIECKALAETTGSMADGIAAGKAWRRWLDQFLTPEQRAATGGRIR